MAEAKTGMQSITIQIDQLIFEGRFNDSHTARAVRDILPIRAPVQTWGEEIYFQIPVVCSKEEGFAQDAVSKGDLAYWIEGKCFCIFFGLTPVSRKDEIRPASTVNVIGRISGKLDLLKTVKDGATVILEKG